MALQGVQWTNPLVEYRAFFLQGNSPSQKEGGMTLERELECRFFGSHLIQRAGRLLKMPQSGMMTGQILFQQFYCQKSFLEHSALDVAMACTLIAGKVEECCRRVRDVVNVFFHLFRRLGGQTPRLLDYVSDEYYGWRDRVTSTEMHVLRQLGFHVQPRHPIGLLANYLNALELSDDPRVAQRAVNRTNDALRGIAYVCWAPEVIACAAIEAAVREVGGLELPTAPEWHLVFDVERPALLECLTAMESVYTRRFDASILTTLAAVQFIPPAGCGPRAVSLAETRDDNNNNNDSNDSKAVHRWAAPPLRPADRHDRRDTRQRSRSPRPASTCHHRSRSHYYYHDEESRRSHHGRRSPHGRRK